MGVDARGQHPGQVADDAAPGDVGHRPDVDVAEQPADRGGVDDRRLQQLVGDRTAAEQLVVEGEAGPLEQHLAGQRVAVGPQPRRRQADQHVAGPGAVAGQQAVPLGHPDHEADQVELPGFHGAGVLGHLAARPARSPPGGNPRPRPRRAPRPGPGRAGPPRCSRGRTAARRPGTRCRPRTWRRGRCRSCRSARRPGPPSPWCRRRRSTTRAPGRGSRRAGRRGRRTRRGRRPPLAGRSSGRRP